MSFTYGFYNSVNHDRRYDAKQISSMFDGLITDGVYRNYGKCFSITIVAGLQVSIGEGRAWFNTTWSYNDSELIIDLPAANQVYNRIDAIIIRVDKTNRTNELTYKSGTPGSEAAKPELSSGADDVFEYPLAYITVSAKATQLVAENIELAIGTAACPFVTGILESVPIDTLMRQWKKEYDDLIFDLKNRIDQVSSEQLIDGSITYEKLASTAVRLRFQNVAVETSYVVENSTYAEYGYPYRAEVPLLNSTSTMRPDISYTPAQIESMDLTGPVETYDGGVYIYLAEAPTDVFIIPVIDLWR
uniref:Receptor Binding Protein n=1 Tax=Siphoviridae sp. ctWT735 TaxID=2825538 RepID=A0A8S5TU53_9CAUD|nr:MAG TPA: Receptor Binding Protein [Siphoviridae sp. ctWT735]